MKRTVIFTAISLIYGLTGCSNSNSSEKGDVESTISATENSEEEIQQSLDEIEKEEKALQARTTTLKFDKTTVDFGKIKEDTENKASYVVTNTGKVPLIIEKVDVSCGCTTAKKPEKPIPPGGSDKIEMVFHPKVGQLDQQNKTITVTANTQPKTTELQIKAFVVKK
jgi:hypothetical protein